VVAERSRSHLRLCLWHCSLRLRSGNGSWWLSGAEATLHCAFGTVPFGSAPFGSAPFGFAQGTVLL
ncbi:MAG: hypothetical protein AB8F95_00915, partial [Bacteroidia bacterium]